MPTKILDWRMKERTPWLELVTGFVEPHMMYVQRLPRFQ
jgi:hypothetical protein